MWFLLLAVLVAAVAPGSADKPLIKSTGSNCKCVDIIFALDLPDLSNAEFEAIRDFIGRFMSLFKKPLNDVRFAVLEFQHQYGRVIFGFDHRCNLGGSCGILLQKLVPPQYYDSISIADGLESVKGFLINDRDDEECPDLIVLFSGGMSYVDPVPIANDLKNNYNASIAAIGVGNVNVTALLEIVSKPEFILLYDDIPSLLKLVDDLKVIACESIRNYYNPACQTCCCGEVYGDMKRQYPDRKSKCCAEQRYDPKRATCCQIYLYEGFDERWTRCCYARPYDPRYSTCCNWRAIVPATRSQDQCCGNTAYNQKHEICCQGRVYRRLKHTQCCGSVAYNPKWEICCRYQVREGCSATYRCCGYRSYNPRREVCVNPYFSYVRPSPIKYCGQDITLYCGTTVWDPQWNTCCAGRVHPGAVDHNTGCCRDQRYDLNNQLCCDGKLWDVDPSWYRCCGYNYYDPWDQTCCHGYYVMDGKGLCCYYNKLFNPKNQICCGGYAVYDGRPSRTKCCYNRFLGFRPYDTKTQMCCYGKIAPGGKHYGCCRFDSYNTKTDMCCSNGLPFSRRESRLLQRCDPPTGINIEPPFDELDAADESAETARPLPVIEDDPDDANGLNAENDTDDQPASETAGGVDVGSGEVETAGGADVGSGEPASKTEE